MNDAQLILAEKYFISKLVVTQRQQSAIEFGLPNSLNLWPLVAAFSRSIR